MNKISEKCSAIMLRGPKQGPLEDLFAILMDMLTSLLNDCTWMMEDVCEETKKNSWHMHYAFKSSLRKLHPELNWRERAQLSREWVPHINAVAKETSMEEFDEMFQEAHRLSMSVR